MQSLWVCWGGSAAVMVAVAVFIGLREQGRVLGILVDGRGRYSLTHFQVVSWTFVILSLISGVFFARIDAGSGGKALDFDIPDVVLLVLGISLGSGAAATAVKAGKDHDEQQARFVAASARGEGRFSQIFLVEEGTQADKAVDVTKFQNFWITLLLLVAYVTLVISTFKVLDSPAAIEGLPAFTPEMVTLLGISHAGYLAGKLPNKSGTPPNLSVAGMRAGGRQPPG